MSTGMGVGAGVSMVGSDLQSIAAGLEQRAMGNAYRNQLAQQQRYADQAMQGLYSALPYYTVGSANAIMGDAANQRQQGYRSIGSVPLSISQPSYPSSGLDAKYADLLGGQRAKLGAYGDWQFQQGLYNQGQRRGLNQLIDTARGQSSLLPYQMYQAQHSQDTLAALGKWLSTVGAMGAGGSQISTDSGPQIGSNLAPSYQQAYSIPMWQQGFQTPYGYVPQGWNQMGGAYEGVAVPG